MEDYSDELEQQKEGNPNVLIQLKQLILNMMEMQLEEERLEEELKEAKKKRRHYEENLIPSLMEEYDIPSITTGGYKIELTRIIRASFPKNPEKREAAFRWLRETGNDGIIKNEFRINFGRNDTEFAEKFKSLLEKEQVDDHATIQQEQNIHSSTLKAFVKEQLNLGTGIPLEDFGAFEQNIAKVKPA